MEELEKRAEGNTDCHTIAAILARNDTASGETELSGDRFEVVKKVMDGYMKTEGGAQA